MRRTKNLIFTLLVVLTACGKKTSAEQREIRIEIGQETIYKEARNRLFIPVKLTNKTGRSIRLDLCNFRYSLLDENEEMLQNGSFGGFLIAGQLDPNRYGPETNVNFLPNHDTSFNLITPIKVKEILTHDELRIILTVRDEDGNVVGGPIKSLITITEQKGKE